MFSNSITRLRVALDDQERPIFDAIVAELGDLVEAAMAVRYAKQGHLEEGEK